MSGAWGFQAGLGIDTANPTTVGFDFISESLVCDEEFIDTNGLRGTRSRVGERVLVGLRRIHGSLSLRPNAVELSNLLRWIMGGAPSGSPTVTYPLADTVPTRYVQIDRVGKVYLYSTVFVNRAVFRASQGGPLELELDLVGVDETLGNSGSWSHPTLDTANGPWTFQQVVFSLNSLTLTAKSFELSIDNHIDADRFFNSATLSTGTNAMDRSISLSLGGVPYNDFVTMYNTGVAGVGGTITCTNSGAIFTIPIQNWKIPRKSPRVGGRQEIPLDLTGAVYRTGSTLEFGAGVTLAVGP